jgi:hypothetical protein
VSWQLVAEVASFLNRDDCKLTPSERLVLFAIAERSPTETRRAYQGGESDWNLARIVGVRLPDVLGRLAERGIDVRVKISEGDDGRAVYACRGRQASYRLPALPSFGSAVSEPLVEKGSDPPSFGSGQSEPYGKKGSDQSEKGSDQSQKGSDTAEKGSDTADPYQSSNGETGSSSSGSPPSRIPALVELGATEDEEEIIIRRVTAANPSIGSLGRYLAAMHTNGDLAPLLDRVRAERRESAARDAVAAAKRAARRLPACEHGVPGGAIVRHPVSGGMLCPLCRLPHDGGGQPGMPEGGGGQPEAVVPARAVGRAKVPAPNVLEVPRTRQPTGRCPKPGHGAMPGGLRLDGSPHCVCCRAEARAEARAAAAAARNTGDTDGGRHRADADPGADWDLPTGVIKLADYRPAAATRIA